jgi:hypothetical protein
MSVDIGHVILDGLQAAPQSPERLGRMTELALARLFERDVPSPGPENANIAEIVLPSAVLSANAGDAEIAEALARALYQALRTAR